MEKVRILIADDHALFCTGVREIIRRGGWEVCAEARNGRDAVAQALEVKPDVVVIDVSMPELNGIEAIRQIVSAQPHIKIILLTMHKSEEVARKALEAGARGYVLKSDAGEFLQQAIQCVLTGSTFFTSAISELVLDAFVRKGPDLKGESPRARQLTPREREVLQLLAEGKISKEVAKALGTSTSTVETQRKSIMRKLKLRTVSDLVRYAIRNHLIEA